MTLAATRLPSAVAELGRALCEGLRDELGNRFVSAFLYGSVCFPPSVVADFDGHVIVSEPFTDDDRVSIKALHGALRSLPLGDELDLYYVTLDDARRSTPPRSELNRQAVDDHWALHRAHVHAGRFALLHGSDPREILRRPEWRELDEALHDEVSSLAEEGSLHKTKPYAVLQLCRVLYSYETRDVVVSKLHSALWALAFLDVEHHPLVHAALKSYATGTYTINEDVRGFYEVMAARIAAARARML